MEEKSFRVEMATENAPRGRFYFANLDLPAKDYEILDAHQRARSFTAAAGYQDIVITRCDTLPQLTDVRLDCPTNLYGSQDDKTKHLIKNKVGDSDSALL